jgi:hypothetical protein
MHVSKTFLSIKQLFMTRQEEPSVSIPLACCDKRDVPRGTVKVEIRRSDSMTMGLTHSEGIATYARLCCLAPHRVLLKRVVIDR